MSANTGLIVLTLCLLGCAAEKPYDHEPTQSIKSGVMYRSGDGQDAIQCQGGHVPKICGSVGFTAKQIYFDCSDPQFECLLNAAGADVLAIPRAGLSLGQNYSAFGANLTVERCFGEQASCEMALIRSECTRTCSCRSAVRGRTTKFYFSRELGVTAFYTTSDVSSLGVDSKMLADTIPLMTYVLVAEKGFLRTPLALRKATADFNCRN